MTISQVTYKPGALSKELGARPDAEIWPSLRLLAYNCSSLESHCVPVANFRNYLVWRAAYALARDLYRATEAFPKREWYELARQIRRSGGSIPSDLAEGLGKEGDREKARYLNIALGSAYELDCQLLLARDLGYVDTKSYEALYRDLLEVRRMLHGLHRRITGQARHTPR